MSKKNITLPVVSMAADPNKFNAAEMGGPKNHKRGKSGRKTHDPQAAMLAARKRQFGTVAPSHEDATEQRKDRAVEAGGETFVDGQRVRRVADPLETLYRKGLLAPRKESDTHEDPMNFVLYQAGVRYRQEWTGAGFVGIAAQDLTRDIVDGGVGRNDGSDYAAECWKKVRAVADAVGPRLLPYLNGLTVDEKPVSKMAASVTDTRSQRLAEAIAMERVREALHRVAEVFNMHPNTRPRPIIAAADDRVTREVRLDRGSRKPISACRSDVTAGLGAAALGSAAIALAQDAREVVRGGFR